MELADDRVGDVSGDGGRVRLQGRQGGYRHSSDREVLDLEPAHMLLGEVQRVGAPASAEERNAEVNAGGSEFGRLGGIEFLNGDDRSGCDRPPDLRRRTFPPSADERQR